MGDESHLIAIVGKADMCELLARAFAFPDEELVSALNDDSFMNDCVTCLEDVGCEDADRIVLGIRSKVGREQNLYEVMRREYSLLYLNPARVLVYPYESAFLHMEHGRDGVPSLFRSAVALDVESQMREAGVAFKDARAEPCDSVFREFEFMSFLYGSLAASIQQENSAAKDFWSEKTGQFLSEHVMKWMPAFMERTVQRSSGGVYGAMAGPALAFLAILANESDR